MRHWCWKAFCTYYRLMTDDDIIKTAALLKLLKPGRLPYPIFEQIARLVALPILELIPYRRTNTGNLEILLLERPADDPFWPNLFHTPGTVIRATDLNKQANGVQLAFSRLVRDELLNTNLGPPKFVASLLHESKRGVEQAQVYCAELLDDPKTGHIFAINNLPKAIVAHQNNFINKVADYLKGQTG